MGNEIAISVKNVSKAFRIPHEKVSSVRGAFVGIFSSFHLPFVKGGKGGVSYEEFQALDNISFEVKKGEFIGIIGRNGSGKSTLLKVLAGIYEADKGSVRIDGMISPFLELGIGFNPELSGRDNIYLNATVLGMSRRQIDEKFDSIVEFSELGRFIDQKLKNYSSGMQVRLAFSVSIHANRDILLMDEVLAVGDTNFQVKCLEEFVRYKEMDKTVILVTHDIATAQRYCDRVMLLRNGKIEMIGDSENVVSEYVLENMTDEERRIARLNDKKAIIDETESVTEKMAEAVTIRIYNAEHIEKDVFETGESVTIEIGYEIRKDVESPVFGLILKDTLRNDVFVINTRHKKLESGLVRRGNISVLYDIQSRLATGTYYVAVGMEGIDRRSLDWKDNFGVLHVMNRAYDSGGIVDFHSEISLRYD
ncbi:MAG TPA: ABC transporter ATP-binding protein [Candidatus Fimivivens sp.]|nr:ABC transporter ATP-binding protein [Candidatus Fimivivens sp.]